MAYFVISFLLYGKFASWRDPSTVAVIKSYIYPSNTNIIGILGAALGISDEKKLLTEVQANIYGIGIQGLFDKHYFTDRRFFLERLYNYSHLREIDRIKTIQTWEYIINPRYRIFVVTESKEFANKLKYHLDNPEYPIYLGRHEFIGKIDNVILEKDVSIVTTTKEDNIENTHIETFNNRLEIIPYPYAQLYFTKKLKRYYRPNNLYDENMLVDICEIIGSVKVRGEKIEKYGDIPIIRVI